MLAEDRALAFQNAANLNLSLLQILLHLWVPQWHADTTQCCRPRATALCSGFNSSFSPFPLFELLFPL